MTPGMSRGVLVTGASGGIGEALTRRLLGEGFTVFAGVRTERAMARLAATEHERLVPLHIDVTHADGIRVAAAAVRRSVGDRGLQGLVNNAGITVIGPLEALPIEDLRHQLEVNLVGQVAVTQALLPLIREGRGRVVNMGSITGRLSFPFAGPYSASKAALAALSDSLRVELKPWDIPVSMVEAGNIKTEIWRKHSDYVSDLLDRLPEEQRRLYKPALEADLRMVERIQRGGAEVTLVEDAVLHALTAARPRARYLVGPDARSLAVILTFLPTSLRDALIQRYMGVKG